MITRRGADIVYGVFLCTRTFAAGTLVDIEGSDNVQSDWNQTDTTADDYIKNKPAMTTETLTFTLQGGTTQTVTVWTQPTV